MEDKNALDIQVEETTEVTESLKNKKMWPNGVKVFSSVKVNPPQSLSLGIRVGDGIKISEKIG